MIYSRIRDFKVFAFGYAYGRIHGEVTARVAATVLEASGFSLDGEPERIFCNGSIDGAAQDRWRLRLSYRRMIEA